MAKKKQEDAPKGSPAWMATFSDLMNLLLCFFVLLFSMSTVDAEKFELMVQSLQSSFSILPAGGSAVGEGNMVSAGISQLENLDIYYKEANSPSKEENNNEGSGTEEQTAETETDIREQYMAASLEESEQMAEDIETMLQNAGIGDKVDLDVTAQYVRLTLNGALLFDSGKSDIREDALPLVDKLAVIVETYSENMIGIEGHTDNVPVVNPKYEDNDVLSAYRALAVKTYFVEHTTLEPGSIRAVSCGEYAPVADNGTKEGRALNRRVEIKIYNSYNSY